MKIYFWKCCDTESKLKDGSLLKARTQLEKHESKVHQSKKKGLFGYYLK